jgi:hypothetical protein
LAKQYNLLVFNNLKDISSKKSGETIGEQAQAETKVGLLLRPVLAKSLCG